MSIELRVKKIVAEQLGVNESEVKNESSFVNDLGADSLDTVELVMALEEEFECEIQMKMQKNHHSTASHRLRPGASEIIPCIICSPVLFCLSIFSVWWSHCV